MHIFERIVHPSPFRKRQATVPSPSGYGLFTAFIRIVGGLALMFAALIPAIAQTPHRAQLNPLIPEQSAAAPAFGTAEPPPRSNRSGAELTKTDVDTWLDGYIPYALQSGDIAGAVVIVVKDGRILTQRGFGYANVEKRQKVDPVATMFRVGSVSKLFTWTAVMQQVQAGKLSLDRDVNDYLDFRIPPKFGKPITLRNLMTHTPGFEETIKYLIVYDSKKLPPLKAVLDRWIPERIYAPGTMPAYSNYGAALAGYIVERVSGEPFEEYIRHHIFAPLSMTSSSFSQPLPPALMARMSRGYTLASQPAGKFELIRVAPAGALSTTGPDMARFMIAHLTGGGPLLNPQTTHLMHSPANRPVAGLPAMALGFYHEDRNGVTIIGHGGDTAMFHSDLHLYLGKGVGLFIALNSTGKQGAANPVRDRLFAEFTGRYFPASTASLPTAKSAHEDGAAMAGHYISSRRSDSNFARSATLLGNATVSLNADDTISVSNLIDAAGVPKRWREVGRWRWVDAGGDDQLGAVVKDGHIAYFSTAQLAPITEMIPAPPGLNAGWMVPVTLTALFVMLVTAIGWPVVALVRRHYKAALPLTKRDLRLHRSLRITAWLMLVIAVGWFTIIAMMGSHLEMLDGRLDGWMWLLQILALLAVVGTALALWNAYAVTVNNDRRWVATGWSIIAALAAVFLLWLAFDLRLITFNVNF